MRIGLVSGLDWRDGIARLRAAGAELICLPLLSFAPWVAAKRDRAGLEHAERPPSPSLLEAIELADGAWISASAYESEGEGVFYVSSYIAGPDGPVSRYRQAAVVAEPGRYEQMFWSPGHEGNEVAASPLGPTGSLVGSDVRSAPAWEELVSAGARAVVCGVAEDAESWPQTMTAVAGLAALHSVIAVIVNRGGRSNDVEFPGGGAAFDRHGAEIGTGELIEVAPG
ncbi:MAG: hypothetical protein BroJett022_24120 [Actinomycetes bacterium]|nr:MAG: hypothetical protein BroJett022_24120 [Actinomycetes bacterium]